MDELMENIFERYGKHSWGVLDLFGDDALEKEEVPACIQSAFGAGAAAEPFDRWRAREYLDAAEAHGLKVMMGFDRMMVVRSSLDGVRQRVSALGSHPGLYGWYLIDEPSLQGATPEATSRAYSAIRQAGNASPVGITICDRNKIDAYMESADVIMVDVYPVSTSALFSLVGHVETALSATGGKKPVWAIIQVHSNDLHVMKWGTIGHLIKEPRRPTVQEVRCMTYLAIAHGASGIFFYAYDSWIYGKIYEDPVLYAGVRQLTQELSGYSPWLLGECLAKGAVDGADGTVVSYIVRGDEDGEQLLVAVNSFNRPAGPVRLPISDEQTLTVNLDAHSVLIEQLAGAPHQD